MRHEASIFLVTYDGMPELTEDDQLLGHALAELGTRARPVCWNDPRVTWQEADIAVLRSTWDYIFSPERFKEWIEFASSRTVLVNSKELLLWNMHKSYLIDLQRSGIEIVPTSMIERGSNPELFLNRALKLYGEQIVIKPAISCASNLTRPFRLSDPNGAAGAINHLDLILEKTDALIQPLIKEVFEDGEHSLIFLDGEYSHTVAKEPFRQGITPTDAKATIRSANKEILFCKKVLSKLSTRPTYARVDIMVRNPKPLLNELELIEPELHLGLAIGSAAKFASLIIEKCRRLRAELPAELTS